MQTKICSCCKEAKELTEFPTRVVSGRTYLRVYCRRCNWQKCKSRRDPEKQRQSANRNAKRKRADPVLRARYVLRDIKTSDRKRGMGETDLTVDLVRALIQENCRYCLTREYRMGLDRLDNEQAHTAGNVVPCCSRCNYIRRDMPFVAWERFLPVLREAVDSGLFGDWSPGPIKCSVQPGPSVAKNPSRDEK